MGINDESKKKVSFGLVLIEELGKLFSILVLGSGRQLG